MENLKHESLHLGHLKGQEKDKAVIQHFGYKGNSKGINLHKVGIVRRKETCPNFQVKH